MTYETRAVLAGAYLKRRPANMLTHSIELDHSSGRAVETRVLCGRVQLDSLADRHAHDPYTIPTCDTCARRLRKILNIGAGFVGSAPKPGGGA